MIQKQLVTGLVALSIAFTAASASATSFSLSSPGPLGVVVGFLCPAGTPACAASPSMVQVGTTDVVGTFDVVGSGLATASLSLDATGDITFVGLIAGVIDTIILSDVSVSFSGIPMLESPLAGGLTAYTQLSDVVGTITGTVTALAGTTPLALNQPFSESVVLNALTCSTPTGQCGFNLLSSVFLNEDVVITNQVNLLVPEPGTGWLLGASLVAAGATRRRLRA